MYCPFWLAHNFPPRISLWELPCPNPAWFKWNFKSLDVHVLVLIFCGFVKGWKWGCLISHLFWTGCIREFWGLWIVHFDEDCGTIMFWHRKNCHDDNFRVAEAYFSQGSNLAKLFLRCTSLTSRTSLFSSTCIWLAQITNWERISDTNCWQPWMCSSIFTAGIGMI